MNSNWLIDYPVWDLGWFGGGFLIALIATIHVYVAHFAVGGGLFLVLTEMKGYRDKSREILDYTRRHTRFFLLLTLVFGAMTGVAIWFTISVLAPAATSVLIHRFIYGWATEWVFFLGEIVTIIVYYHYFGKMRAKDHLFVGWLYFAFGWLSLFVINGIISYMLTPGQWLETHNFWDGFFNPSFWPSLFFRSFIAFMLAGLFGFITCLRIEDAGVRQRMIRYCAYWLLIPFALALIFAFWYLSSLPEAQKEMILMTSPEIMPMIQLFLIVSGIIFVAGVLMALKSSLNIQKGIAAFLLIPGFLYMGSFEWIREAGRRPYLIYDYIYSNGIYKKDMDAIREKGILQSARWVENRSITEGNRLAAGEEIFRLLCISCHSVGGPMNDILPITDHYSVFAMEAALDGMGNVHTYMPPFPGTVEERNALAVYIVEGLHQKKMTPATPITPASKPVDIPPFDSENDAYVLLAWSGKGMRLISGDLIRLGRPTPGNEIFAQLIKRGETPEHVYNADLMYHIDNADGTANKMTYDSTSGLYTAKNIDVTPFEKNGSFNPYPLVSIEAVDRGSGNVIARTTLVAPVSSEIGCKNCHGGEADSVDGIGKVAAKDILAAHDKGNRTDLLQFLKQNKTVHCWDCHSGPKIGDEAKQNLNLSAAIHGYHAGYLTNRGAESCAACHPSSPDTYTKCFRGIHRYVLLDCTNCHGTMEDHALSLLRAEKQSGKKVAEKLMENIPPRSVSSIKDIEPRQPWINEPDCLNCHVDFGFPETDRHPMGQWTLKEADQYRFRTDQAGVVCAACHGAPHVLYPATNIFGNDRDNIPPMQYQGEPYPIAANKNCRVCHTIDMIDEIHHPNSLAAFRNTK